MIEVSSLHLSINELPNELLLQIASHLDSVAPSILKFAHEPTPTLTDSTQTSLKILSCVSWRWRKITLPLLFNYTRIPLDNEAQWVPVDARLVDSMQEQLQTLSDHEFQIYYKMRNKFKTSSMFAFDEQFDDVLINLCRIQQGDDFLKAVPHILWLPHLTKSFGDFAKFVTQYELKHHIKSIVMHTDKEYELRHVSTADAPLARAVADIWVQVFSVLDPCRVVVAAPPTTLAGLLDTQMLSADAWAFDMKIHYIELKQSERGDVEHRKMRCRAWDSALIHRRPWYHLAYNEGSSITAYSTYEYHLKQSPKMLYLILLRLAKEAKPCCNITSFSFVGIFAFSTNVLNIIRVLHRIRTIKRTTFQLAPGKENNLLTEPKRLGRAQARDLWLEWNENYKSIAAHLVAHDFEDGAEFQSHDCHSSELAQEIGEYIDLLTQRGIGWRKSNDEPGLWTRDSALDREYSLATAAGLV